MKYIDEEKKMYADNVVAIVPIDPWLRFERETPLTGSGVPDCATTSPRRAYTGTKNAYMCWDREFVWCFCLKVCV